MDVILGGLPDTTQKAKSIFAVANIFSKNAHFIPCNRSHDVLKIETLIFKRAVHLYGIPKTIVSNWDVKLIGYF